MANYVEYQLEVEGIEVVFATQFLPPGDDGDLVRPGYYFAAKMYSKSMAFAIARGSQAALESGTMAYCTVARKQQYEKVTLVPGDPDELAIVVEISCSRFNLAGADRASPPS